MPLALQRLSVSGTNLIGQSGFDCWTSLAFICGKADWLPFSVRPTEILSNGAGLAFFEDEVPTGTELRISKEQELSFNRLLKFFSLHEPTGYEKDEAHKRSVVQCVALRSMLAECKAAKVILYTGCALKLERISAETNHIMTDGCVYSFALFKKRASRKCFTGLKKPQRILGCVVEGA